MKTIIFVLSILLYTAHIPAFFTPASLVAVEKIYHSPSEQAQETPSSLLNDPVFPPEEFIGAPAEPSDRFWSEFVSMLATLGLIIALILLVAWFLKRLVNTRLEQANSSSSIKIVERRPLSPKTTLYLLEVADQSYFVAESINGITLLATPNSTPLTKTAPTPNMPSTFKNLLDRPNE